MTPAHLAEIEARKFPIGNYGTIPWDVAQRAYEVYAKKYGTRQTLQRIAERGGFGVDEMDMFLPDWRERVNGWNALLAALKEARAEIVKTKALLCLSVGGRIDVPDRVILDFDPKRVTVEEFREEANARFVIRVRDIP